jgi:hypothetical protein
MSFKLGKVPRNVVKQGEREQRPTWNKKTVELLDDQ